MKKKILCEKCGQEMISIDENIPVGKTCTNCGWGWATSFINPIYNDIQIYTVTLTGVVSITKEIIKTIAEITGQNFLQIKRALENLPQIVFSGKAPEVLKISQSLKSKPFFDFKISPNFPYDN